MYISQVKIRNFRSFKSLDLELRPGKNVIVGKNNSGKSNIIKALDYVLGERYPTYINFGMEDFHAIDSDEPQYSSSFTICVQLKHGENNTDYNKKELLKYQRNIGYIIRTKPIFNEDTQDIDEDYLYSDEKYNQIYKYWKDPVEISSKIEKADSISIYLHVKREMGDINKYFGIILHYQDTEERDFIFTVNKNLRDSLITSAMIPAVRSPNSDLRINNYSWYSKILKELWNSDKNSESREKLMNLNKQIQEEANTMFSPAVSEITTQISQTVHASSVTLHLLEKNEAELYKTAKIYVNDSGLETTLENKGTGTQSCVIISLFVQYCKMMHRSGSLLAIEEPECYLHPHARRALSSYLDSFIQNDRNNGKPNNQIILTTHSPEFLKGTQLENVHVLRKDVSGTSTVSSIPPDDAGIKEYKQKIEMIINREDAEMFFADCVILVEGGEKHLLPLIADLKREEGLVDNPLDRYNISVVRVGGKGNFKVYVTLLKRLGIPYYLIADFDMLYGGVELSHLGSDTCQWILEGHDPQRRCEVLRTWREAIKGIIEIDKKAIKEQLCSSSSYDGQKMCHILDTVCTNGEITDELRQLWIYIKNRHHRKKINYSSVKERITDPSLIPLDEILRKLFEDEHIYILREGELEDYYSERGCSIPGGKEVKALGIADAVCTDMRNSQENRINTYLNVSEYQLVINRAIQDCKNRLQGDS